MVPQQWLTLKILQRGGAWLCYPLATKTVRLHSALIKWFCFFNRVAMDDNFLQDKAAPPPRRRILATLPTSQYAQPATAKPTSLMAHLAARRPRSLLAMSRTTRLSSCCACLSTLRFIANSRELRETSCSSFLGIK